jgi:histidine triad (HIT) family protein
MNCVFCSIIKGKIPSHKVYEDDQVLAFLDINPSAKGHTLIIPKLHEARIENLPKKDSMTLFNVLHKLIDPIQRAVNASASTIGINNGKEAGQEVPHIHIHVIPRRQEDRGSIIQAITRTSRPSKEEFNEVANLIRCVLAEH